MENSGGKTTLYTCAGVDRVLEGRVSKEEYLSIIVLSGNHVRI